MPLRAGWQKWCLWGKRMQADLRHTGFFTGKVKAFSTERKGPQKIVFSGKWLKKCFPFVFASAFMLTACSEDKGSATQDEYRKIYTETVDYFHLNELEDREPFTFEEIQELMKGKDTPALNDTNYNHCPENVANFWEIMKNGIAVTKEVQNSDTLTAAQKKEYRTTMVKMLSRMARYKDKRPKFVQFLAHLGLAKDVRDSVDLTHYGTQQAFLYGEKVDKFKGDYKEVLKLERGESDERSGLIGRYYQDFEELSVKADKYPGVERFAKAFYLNEDRFILANEDISVTEPISKRMFEEWSAKNGIKDTTLWQYAEELFYSLEYNGMDYFTKRGVKFGVSMTVNRNGHNGSPVYAVIPHEFMHFFQLKPGSNERPFHNKLSDETVENLPDSRFDRGHLAELGPSLFSLMWDDLIYKEAHGIKKDKVVDYGVVIDTGENKIEAGELAVVVQNWVNEASTLSMDKILSQKKVLEYFNRLGGGDKMCNRAQIVSSEMHL